MTRSEALQILELESLPNSEELRRAHRQMVRVWHPDRFPGDEALISKANEKTAQINEAFGVLRKLVEVHPSKPSPQEPTTRQDPQPSSRAPQNKGPNTKTSDTPAKDQAEVEEAQQFRRSADQGLASAQFNLGVCYANGRGLIKSQTEAFKWFRLAAVQGYVKAQNNLGFCYAQGQGITKDESEAFKWYRLAAEQGYVKAQFSLGLCYENGHGVSKDPTEAVKWFRLAAEQRYANAQFHLGLCYDYGRGVPKDEDEAIKWYRLAADQGHPDAKLHISGINRNRQSNGSATYSLDSFPDYNKQILSFVLLFILLVFVFKISPRVKNNSDTKSTILETTSDKIPSTANPVSTTTPQVSVDIVASQIEDSSIQTNNALNATITHSLPTNALPVMPATPEGASETAPVTSTTLEAPPEVNLTTDARIKIPNGFALIPAGAFQMGDALDGISDAPVRTVNVSDFYISKTEVTKAEWDEVCSWGVNRGYTDLADGGGKASNHPVHNVTWLDVIKWCNAKSEKDGLEPVYAVNGAVMRIGITAPAANWAAKGYRLPTEAEWEKAARGGLNGKRFPWGDTISHKHVNYKSSSDYAYDGSSTYGPHSNYAVGDEPYTSPVGSFSANGYGVHDMAGNVWEWCWDWYGEYASGAQLDPKGAASGAFLVVRGGGWDYDARYCRAANRDYFSPSYADYYCGFRVACSSASTAAQSDQAESAADPLSLTASDEFNLSYSVIGITENDTLNVRSGPGSESKIVARLSNGSDGIRIIGEPVFIGNTEWVLIYFRKNTGWVAKQYLHHE